MKIKYDKEVLIIYLYNHKLSLEDRDRLTKDIKELLIKLIKRYQYNLCGVYQVIIYENKKYGYVLEILCLKEYEYSDYIDIKLEIKEKRLFYLAFDNYAFIEDCQIFMYKNNRFYVNIDDIKNVNSKIEFGELIYKDDDVLKIKNVKEQILNVN